MNKIIAYSPEATELNIDNFKKIGNAVGFEPIIANSLKEVFSLINGDAQIKAVVINIDEIIKNNNINILDVINAIDNIRRMSDSDPITTAAYSINDIDAVSIRKILHAGIKGFLIFNRNIKFEDKVEFFTEILSGHKYLHRDVQNKINNVKKKAPCENKILLTPRQQEVLDLICSRGASNKNIARILNLSESTVKLHIGAILKKYGLVNRTQLALFAKSKQ